MTVSPDILIIGAGVLGLACAGELSRRGRSVTVIDPSQGNASRVAAGMIAPAFEALADGRASGGVHDRGELFRAGRDLWPELADSADLDLHREGAEWRGPDPDGVASALRALGFQAEQRGQAVFTPEDWRVDPLEAMARLAAAPGVTMRRGRAQAVTQAAHGWGVRLGDGETLAAAHVVVATGAEPALGLPQTAARPAALIQPIRGQLAFMPALRVERAVRGAHGYVAPAIGGAVIGASMDTGRRDLTPDPQAGGAQVAACLAMLGLEKGPEPQWRVGVRGASPDGLPLAGAADQGLHLALAPRRNGWLLAPLVARVVADGVEGRAPSVFARPLDPARFRV